MNQKKEIKQTLELILGGPIVLSDHSEEEKLKEELKAKLQTLKVRYIRFY